MKYGHFDGYLIGQLLYKENISPNALTHRNLYNKKRECWQFLSIEKKICVFSVLNTFMNVCIKLKVSKATGTTAVRTLKTRALPW
jgi:hypothetical protein